MSSLDELPLHRRRIKVGRPVALLLVAMLVVACSGGDDGADDDAATDGEPNRTPPPTLAGGVELPAVDPLRLLAGEGLAYGAPLPSQEAAADAYLEDPEVKAATARRLHGRDDGRLVGEVLLLTLDGQEVFDTSVLDAFVEGAVGALGGDTTETVTIAGRPVLRSRGSAGTVLGYREGDQLMLVRGTDDAQVTSAVDRQLQALAAGALGAAEPFTPLVPVPIGAAFVPVPTLSFQPIPPPEEEIPPDPPVLPGATASEGRYGVDAGERRSTVWAYSLDPAAYPNAEKLEPALAALVSARAGGAPAEVTEVLGRVVLRADGSTGSPSARAFRHQGIALLIEGPVPAQLDAAVTAWLTALG